MPQDQDNLNSLDRRLIAAGQKLAAQAGNPDLAHFKNRTANTIQRALPKPNDPFQSLRNSGVIPSAEGGDEFEALRKTRALSREYYRSHNVGAVILLSLIHISEPTRRLRGSRMPSSA